MIRNKLVVIAVNMENRDLYGSQRLESFGGVVFVKRCFQFIFCHVVSARCARNTGIAFKIANRINPGDATHFFGIFDSPIVEHQASSTSCQETGFFREVSLSCEIFVEFAETLAAVPAAIGLANINSSNCDSLGQKSLEHPDFGFGGETRQGGCVPNPWRLILHLFRKDDEGITTIDPERFS